MAVEAVAGARGEGADAEGAVWDVAVDGVAAGRRDAHPVRTPAAGAHRAHLEPPHQPPPAPVVDAAAVQERLPQPRRPRRRLRHIAAAAAGTSLHTVHHTMEGKNVGTTCCQPTSPQSPHRREGGGERDREGGSRTCCGDEAGGADAARTGEKWRRKRSKRRRGMGGRLGDEEQEAIFVAGCADRKG